jgi:Ca-activated chloride channel family protein
VVHSRLDEPTLRAIAEISGGEYYAAENPSEIAEIYDRIATRLVIKPEAQEVTSLFAGAGILVLVIGGLTALRWLGRLP